MLLNALTILMVEDQPFIALDLALTIEDAGGEVMGPAASVAQALELLRDQRPDGAILDVNLPDGLISPVVEQLVAAGVPLVIQTGVGVPDALAARFPDLLVLIKPVEAVTLVELLAEMLVEPPLQVRSAGHGVAPEA